MASMTMIDNMVVYGFHKITAGFPAFINCTAEILTSESVSVLPSRTTVLEVLETVEPTPEVIAACRRLKSEGYRIALDDFVYSPAWEPLIRMADFIKIDYRATSALDRRAMMSKLASFSGAYLAEKVETSQEYEAARKEGFTLFQGYYFCKPDLLRNTRVPANHFALVRLLQLLQHETVDLIAVSEVLKSEPALTYRLLRFANSAATCIRYKVTSVKMALIAVGEDSFRRIATVAIACELNVGFSTEVVRLALIRARFCETAAPYCSLKPTDQYLIGLFSLLDAMLQKPIQESVAPLCLPKPIEDAILRVDSSLRCSLDWLECHERGEFGRCDELASSHGFLPGALEENYVEAAHWADILLSEA